MNENIRRRFKNYRLASESLDILKEMAGEKIKALKIGTNSLTDEEVAKEKIQRERGGSENNYGEPYLISYKKNSTLIIYYDDLMGLIVMREIACDLNSSGFFDLLESEDRLGERIKRRRTIDLPNQYDVCGKEIKKIAVYKLPDNF